MAMVKREKVLAAITGALVAATAIYFLVVGGGSQGNLRAQCDALAKKIEDQKVKACKTIAQVARRKDDPRIKVDTVDLALYGRYISKTTDRLDQWKKQSLPSVKEKAQLLYHAWLRETVDKAEFRSVKFDPGEVRTQRGIYKILPVTVHCRAEIEQLTRFLYDFYSAGHLHRISLLTVTPGDSGDLELTISIEGLSLTEADRADALNPDPGDRLSLAEFSEYRDAIASRNLFAAYVPPPPPVVKRPPRKPRPPPRPPPPPSFDHAKHTIVTGLIEVGRRRQVWLLVRTTDEQFKLFEGETFTTGPLTGTIGHIGMQDVEIEIDGKRRLILKGESVADGLELPE